jgi:hypothetical protein
MQNPHAKPDFVAGLDPSPGSKQYSVNKVWAAIIYVPLWESGETEETIVNSFLSHVKLDIDGKNAPPNSSQPLVSGPAIIVHYKSGETLSKIATIHLCFLVALSSGIHIATLRRFTTS